ncbi:MAG: alpha/beta hydrolase [Candidatus Babeliales bacterium]
MQKLNKEFNFINEEVCYQNKSANITLSGTLTIPENTKPIATVIFIAGFGPNGRDYELLGHKRFLVMSEYLAKLGIATLRYDKRGVGKSTGDYSLATSRDFADDVIVGIKFLKNRKDISSNKIGLIGHSEGGMIASMVAAENKDVDFVVNMAGVVQTDVDGLVTQTAKQLKVDGASQDFLEQDKILRTQIFTIVKQEKDIESAKIKLQNLMSDYWNNLPENLKKEANKLPFAITKDKIENMANMFNSPWYRYFLNYNSVDALKKIKQPILSIYGNKDWIVSAQPSLDIISQMLKSSGNNNFINIELPNLNHSFQACKTGSMAEYPVIKETISPVVLKNIFDWILNLHK